MVRLNLKIERRTYIIHVDTTRIYTFNVRLSYPVLIHIHTHKDCGYRVSLLQCTCGLYSQTHMHVIDYGCNMLKTRTLTA